MTQPDAARRPSPASLWEQARAENPDDREALRARYRVLMIEHGHLIPGTPKPLPCGYMPGKGSSPTPENVNRT